MFEIFEPIIFPKATSPEPLIAAKRLTISSGIEVPNATTVRPITSVETPNFLANDDDPFTNQLAPFIKRIIPKKNNIILIIIFFIV